MEKKIGTKTSQLISLVFCCRYAVRRYNVFDIDSDYRGCGGINHCDNLWQGSELGPHIMGIMNPPEAIVLMVVYIRIKEKKLGRWRYASEGAYHQSSLMGYCSGIGTGLQRATYRLYRSRCGRFRNTERQDRVLRREDSGIGNLELSMNFLIQRFRCHS
jgi:hypothetical protein